MPIKNAILSTGAGDLGLAQVAVPLELDALAEGSGPWEVEIGFGKGRYLLQRAQGEPESRFLGIEIANKYFRIVVTRARKRGLSNLLAVRADAAYLMSAVLPRGFARAVHVYFPDPWPKTRHHKRRLFDPENLDLLFGLLRPDGRLWFATDHLDYGELVVELLERMPGVKVERLAGLWPEGPRTNYEAKYEREGRPIVRLGVRLRPGADRSALHPDGEPGITCAWAPREDPAETVGAS
jgi:tRNA (guanine-N7-)-methyltransferase